MDQTNKKGRSAIYELEKDLAILRSGSNRSSRRQSTSIPEDLVASLRVDLRWVGSPSLCNKIDVHPTTLARLREECGLPAVRFGARWKHFLPSVATWLEAQSAQLESDLSTNNRNTSAVGVSCLGTANGSQQHGEEPADAQVLKQPGMSV
jgi:hypothetical protein